MKARHLNILIILFYVMAALCLLGMGSARQKLQRLQATEQRLISDSTAVSQQGDQGVSPGGSTDEVATQTPWKADKQELQDRLTRWQIIAVLLFSVASLLLVLRDRLVKKPKIEE